MNEEEVNQKFVDIVIDNFSDYKVDEDLFADTGINEKVIELD